MTTLADLTTLRVGGPIAEYVRVSTTDALVDAVAAADASGGPLLVVGGGSNLLASDAPFEGTVVDVQPFGEVASVIHEDPAGSVLVRAGAGTVWDAFVSWTLSQGLSGVEALSGIPGTVGASPVQNVGAYGHEVAETISSVEAYDRLTGTVVRLAPAELGFAYRSSAIKRSVGEVGLNGRPWGPTGRWVVLSVDFRLERSPLSAPVMYSELARRLGVEAGSRADASLVRSTVLDLRRGKGMVLDPADHDTWSAGSFFTNPILPEAAAATLPE
ncbi:UDP-N-acetylmuramate dehydrogenase, partial [Actinomyces bouchesdurhonensis]|uniref:UDP-N-acetylmuramate dehydrogenase n=1 Tax=Actinomyces bouchesdurhonensis TaxID=1852361 RepID=UPI003C77D14C